MRRWLCGFCGFLMLCGAGAVASAAPRAAKAGPEAQFVEFDPQVFEGAIRGPAVEQLDSRARVRFGRLSRLKKSFLPTLIQSAAERIYR